MTLVELLMVMGLLALLLGFGVGSIAGLDIGNYGATGLVKSTLRSTSNWSTARHAPARVRIDPTTGRIAAEGLAVVGTWHFEKQPPQGAFDLDGDLLGAELVEGGFVGKALSFTGTGAGSSYEVPVQTDPAFDLSTGFQVQLALRPENASGARVLLLGKSVQIEATSKFGMKVTVATERFDEETGKPVSAGNAILETPAGVLQPDIWNRVLVSYDRALLSIFVEGVSVASVAEEGTVLPTRSPLVLGGGSRPWSGSIDNLVISAVGASEEVFLPEGAEFPADTIREIVFAAGGGLDRSIHETPVAIEVNFEDGRRETIRVGMYGTVE